jgi:hypothetical protein
MSTIGGIQRGAPGIFYLIHAIRVAKPKILESEDVSLWNISPNLNFTWYVIRGNSSMREDQRVRKKGCPSNRSEKPINLLKKGEGLHVAPSITSTLHG